MKKYYYVYNRSMTYSGPTVKHDLFEKAMEEAMRLAEKHPTHEIEILQAVCVVKAPSPKPVATLLD